jgi:hypothetical protein
MTLPVANMVAAIVILMAAILFTASVVVLALGAKVWADAQAASHRARAHGLTADAEEAVQAAATSALDEAAARPRVRDVAPDDGEIRAAILAERVSRNGHSNGAMDEWTTEQNNGIEEQPPIPPGGMYAT